MELEFTFVNNEDNIAYAKFNGNNWILNAVRFESLPVLLPAGNYIFKVNNINTRTRY